MKLCMLSEKYSQSVFTVPVVAEKMVLALCRCFKTIIATQTVM